MIRVENLKKSFGNLQVLQNIGFEVPLGGIFTILGPSGCGKSTLLRCIAGLEDIDSGNITIDGDPHSSYLSHKRIAFVFQKYSNLPWLTVEQNVNLGLIDAEMGSASKRARVSELISELGLTGFDKYYIHQLSGGMQQRVAIARALAQNSDILFMDEPFGSLDPLTREQLQEMVIKLSSQHGKTILFVTHDIEEAVYVSTRLIVLSHKPGSVAQSYTPSFDRNSPSVKYSSDFLRMRKGIIELIKSN